MTPQTVNAVNLPLQNALNFPAAILEAPFFDPNADAAANYGSIGAVIGHEIIHSFDNLGAEFDADGKLQNWWTKADADDFKASAKQLIAQYNAYDAYQKSLGGKPAPVINGMTGDQRFFLAFAQSWRTKTRDAALRAQIAGDVHAPGSFRVRTVRNVDAWYKAFDVKEGQKLYLKPDERVRVW